MVLILAIVFTAAVWSLPAPATPAPAPSPQEEIDERYTAFAVSMGNVATGRRGRVEFFITRWTPDDERNVLGNALLEGGNDGLRRAFDDTEEVGRVRVGTRLAYPLFYAREIMLDSGIRRIVLATNRQIPFIESWANPRTRDYDISLMILDLDEEDSGSGQAAVGVQFGVNPDNNVLEITNFGSEPVRLTNITRRR